MTKAPSEPTDAELEAWVDGLIAYLGAGGELSLDQRVLLILTPKLIERLREVARLPQEVDLFVE